MAKLYNLARMTTATTGTGTITLGSAASKFLSFAAAGVADGDVVSYGIDDGTNSEMGWGVYTSSGTTLTRNVTKSTNSDAPINLSGSAQVFISARAEDLRHISAPGGRLTNSSGSPVVTSTVSGATTIYYEPFRGRMVPLYDGSSWQVHDFGAALSQATTDSTKSPAACTTNSNYDVFVWLDGSTYRATRGPAWSSSTARGTGAGTTELEYVQGLLVNKQAITNGPAAQRGLYVGTIRTNASSQVDFTYGSKAAGGGAAVLGVWNMYNRVRISTSSENGTDSWTYGTGTWRSANASDTTRVSFVSGLADDAFDAVYTQIAYSTASNAFSGIGYDSTSAFSGRTGACGVNAFMTGPARYSTTALGYHYVQAIERLQTTTTAGTFYGDNGSDYLQTGLDFSFWM